MGLFAKKSYIGVDLGHHTMKAVEIERTPAGWKISRCTQAPTPPDTIRDGVVLDSEAVGGALKQMLKDAGISATGAHIAAAGGAIFVRSVPFPKMSESALRKSIKFEASRYVPGSVEESFVEFEILGPMNESQMNVMIVAAPREIVDSRIRACEEAGLEVESVDVEMFAAYRSLMESNPNEDSQATICLVDIGALTTSMSVVQNGAFAMTRSIPSGSGMLTEALKSYFHLQHAEAEEGKAQLDLRELLQEVPAENPPLRVIQPHLDDLVREIRRSLNYFQSQQSENSEGREVSRLVVCGGGAKMPGAAAYLEHKLGVPVTALGVYDNARFVHSGVPEETGLDLAVASGLAMRAYAKAA